MKKKLQDFLSVIVSENLKNLESLDLCQEVTGITSNSKEVKPGSIFVAVRGLSHDGHDYLSEAESQGAILFIGENSMTQVFKKPYIQVPDARVVLAQLASCFYHDPSDQLLVLGITGTSGKTTTAYLLESILKQAGFRVGVIGTIGSRFEDQIFPSNHTTPGAVELQKTLFQMKKQGCSAVVMEVSSHALKQKRVACLAFDGVLFTNLSPEHLDFHLDMEDYYQSKRLLFTEVVRYSFSRGKTPVGVINQEDPFGQRLIEDLKHQPYPCLKFQGFKIDENFCFGIKGITGKINDVSIQSALIGSFNGFNIAGAVSLAQKLKIPSFQISEGISKLKGVPGRLERVQVHENQKIHICVDYAHKPDALLKVLQVFDFIRCRNRLITVFGCGGDRDRQKRSQMGKIALENSDLVYVTSDNPRNEDPRLIIQEILHDIRDHPQVRVEENRKKAIFEAIRAAKPGDLVLIAGKGHEDYQIIGNQKFPFDDRQVAQEALRQLEESTFMT